MTTPAFAAVVVLQGGIVAILVEAVRRRDGAAAANAVVSLAATLVPVAIEFVVRVAFAGEVSFGPELPLWIAVAGCLHSIGMLGPYDSIRWWDTLTHTVSAALVATLVYAGFVVTARHSGVLDPASPGVAVAAVAFTFAVGVFWELIELVAREVGERYGIEPVLVHYGWRDTALDLVFDVLAALVVVLLDLRLFVPVADQFPRATLTLVVGIGAVVVAGSVAMALWVALVRDRGSQGE